MIPPFGQVRHQAPPTAHSLMVHHLLTPMVRRHRRRQVSAHSRQGTAHSHSQAMERHRRHQDSARRRGQGTADLNHLWHRRLSPRRAEPGSI
jgi:hypothetical protein